MGLPKNRTNNPNGRPPGKPNKITTELRTRIKSFLDDNFETVKKDWKKLDPKDRILLYEKMLSFALPRMKESDIKLNLDEMTDDQLSRIIDKILNDENSN